MPIKATLLISVEVGRVREVAEILKSRGLGAETVIEGPPSIVIHVLEEQNQDGLTRIIRGIEFVNGVCKVTLLIHAQ